MRAMGNNPVAVTGIGMITPLGINTPSCWKNMSEGKSGITGITSFDTTDCQTKIGGELPAEYFTLESEGLPKRLQKQTSLASRIGLLCAKEAIEDSRLPIKEFDPYKCAVITGSGGLVAHLKKELHTLKGSKFMVLQTMTNAISAWISIKYGFKGPSFNIAAACASGGYAVGSAFDYIRSGKGDAAVAVGVDTMVDPMSIQGFNQLRALSKENEFPQKASRPFEAKRSGFVLSNGGCAVILERLEKALQRGARVYALVLGFAISSEAFNIISPEPTGQEMAKTMTMALEDAVIAKEKIDYINAHGTSTHHNDLYETMAIKEVFKDHAYKLAVSSQKSMIGHTIGGAGAIEFATTALSLYHKLILPTINYQDPDPECDLDYVPNQARKVATLDKALSNSFGFGGHNCSLVLGRYA